MKDFCKYVDVFYGNGEVDHYAEEGIGSKWYYIKALCGNTVPHAVLPFGKMSVGAYSGGYPCGYGTHYPNFCGGIRKLSENMKIRGFSHIHHSGTGGIRYYYNYAVVSPFYGDVDGIEKCYDVKDEYAVPGMYKVSFNDVDCSLTVSENTAVHRYSFCRDGGRIAVDFSNDGLCKEFGEKYYSFPKNCSIQIKNNKVLFSGILSGIKMHFCVRIMAKNPRISLFEGSNELSENILIVEKGDKKFGCIFDFDDKEACVYVSYSTSSSQKAEMNVDSNTLNFDEYSKKAYKIWNEYLSKVEIEADDKTKTKFYSNLYHSLIKPIDMTGESILGLQEDVVCDISTFWDTYKTQFPLIFMLYPKMSSVLAKGILNISRTHGKILCSLGLTDKFVCEMQAKMLGVFTLCDAYYMNVGGITKEMIDECIVRELNREDYSLFHDKGVFERYTHILDVTDACYNVARITDNSELKDRLMRLYKNIEKAYCDDGLLSDETIYYEGDRYTYSFRLHANMADRIRLAGGKEKFVSLLDGFFGFGKESIVQPRHVGADKEINSNTYHRFQGFNNECDMESPYSYIYAGEHDKLCEILHECVTESFAYGKGAIPGNNDSGGLSACYLWNALGVFPATGKGEFLVGTPAFEKSVLKLAGGNELVITAENFDGKKYLVESVTFNGKKVDDYILSTKELLCGGELHFVMK